MRRRTFIAGLGSAATWPLVARGQQAKLPTIGFLGANSAAAQKAHVALFVQRLRELGWVEGHDIAIDLRWAEGHYERSPEIVADFVRLKVDAILPPELQTFLRLGGQLQQSQSFSRRSGTRSELASW
jgi:putative ABC transport system substrate-binding protein